MSPDDVIELPGQPGLYARRAIVDAWVRAGSPPVNDAGRLYAKQKDAWDAYQAGTGSPADNPARPDIFPLAHVRFVALDITPTAERIRNLEAQGLVRPYDYESWHWQLPGNIRIYPLVTSLPTTADAGATPFPTEQEEEEDMFGYYAKGDKSPSTWFINARTGKRRPVVLGELIAATDHGEGKVTVMAQATFDAIPKE